MGRLTVTIELALLDIPSHTTISFVAIPEHRTRSQKRSMRLCMLTSVSIFSKALLVVVGALVLRWLDWPCKFLRTYACDCFVFISLYFSLIYKEVSGDL